MLDLDVQTQEDSFDLSSFTIIPNEVLRDKRLSWRARGILAACLSHADNFKINKAWILSNSSEGVVAVTNALAELREFGYLKDKFIRCEGTGKVLGKGLEFTDCPQDGKPMRWETEASETHLVDQPPGGEGALLRKNNSKENQLKEKQVGEDRKPEPAPSPVQDPQPSPMRPLQEPQQAPSAPKSGKVVAVPRSVPSELLPAADLICSFFNHHKAGAKTQKAFAGLITQLLKILRDRNGGMLQVKKQLEFAIERSEIGEKKWSSITYSNWERFGKQNKPVAQVNNRPSTHAATPIFDEDAASGLQF